MQENNVPIYINNSKRDRNLSIGVSALSLILSTYFIHSAISEENLKF